jgi:VCBS repeat-containing protein
MTPQAYGIPTGLYISFNPSSVNNIRGGTSRVTINVLLTPQFLQNGGTYEFAIGMNAILPSTSISSSLVSGTYLITKIAVLTIVIPPAFSIAVNPTVINLYVGAGQQQIQVTVTPLTKGLTDPIVLNVQGVPSGIIGNFQTNILIPNGTQPISTNLVLNAPTGTLPTLGTLHFTAQASGVTSSADASLNVQPQGDYTMQADQTTVEFSGAGQSRTITLTVTPQGGFKSTITFSAANLPAGMTAAFSSVTYNIQQSTPINVILTLTAGQTTQPGTYQFSVVTNTGFSTKSLVLTVLIRAGGTQIWPVILVVVIVIAVVSLIAFVGMPRGREVRRVSERRGEGGYPRLPP